jgi:hypothetical protein
MMVEHNDTTLPYDRWLSIVKGVVENRNGRSLIAVHDVTHQIIGSVFADVSDDIVGMGEYGRVVPVALLVVYCNSSVLRNAAYDVLNSCVYLLILTLSL